jgi:putative transposase
MSTFTQLRYHVVFSTKDRRPAITRDLHDVLHPYLGGIVRNEGGTLLAAGGIDDHVHLLLGLPATRAVADAVRVIKTNSSKWLGERNDPWCGWQTGYAAFTVSQSQVDTVRSYIANQERHHAKTTFKEEFLNLLERHEVEYDERYVWD